MIFLRGVGMGFEGGWAVFCLPVLTYFDPSLWTLTLGKRFVNHTKTGGTDSMDIMERGFLASPPPENAYE